MRIRRADRVTIDAASANSGSPASLDGVIEPEHQRSAGGKGGQQHTKQDEAGMATIPDGTVQNPMIVLKMKLVGQAHHSQSTCNSSLARGQNGPNQQNLRTTPDTLGKERRSILNGTAP